VTLLQPLAHWLPTLVFLIATQKTNATNTTIKVYSTKPRFGLEIIIPAISLIVLGPSSINDFSESRFGRCNQSAALSGLRDVIHKGESFQMVFVGHD